ncbi:MAG TPA: UvrD-helicase domain-containing protein [Acidimicrobiales bacterium]|nr:UvrD-helicase domain-containing protein [Acidimicrobiales bacterium]
MNADAPLAVDGDTGRANAAEPDGPARRRIAAALGETLFVEAGAGSGKTRELVGRIVNLVTTGTAGVDAIAAITFTEKAASELRDRVRRRIEAELERAGSVGDPIVVDRCARALDDLDGAAIGTLHSFAQRLLVEHPIEAGLPPRIDVLDEVASTVAFDDRWAGFVDEVLADEAIERPLLLATAAGVRLTALRVIALAFNDNWDLAEAQAPSRPVEPPQWVQRLDTLLSELAGACAERHQADDDDTLHQRLCDLEDWARRVGAASDEYTKLSLLTSDSRPRGGGRGAKTRWPDDYDLAGLRDRIADVCARCEELRSEVALAAVTRLAVELRRFTLGAAAERRTAGRLEFHDLLVLARQMLRGPHARVVRAALHRRYRHLLIDEFQDTDPIQIELAVLIAGPDASEREVPWDQVAVRPGHLFFVGDPKQSIYRFRRADISLFLRAADRFGRDDALLALTTNYRSTRSVIAAVNHVFGQLIQPQWHGGVRSQPGYDALVAVRDDAPVGPAVSVLGRHQHGAAPAGGEPGGDGGEPAATTPRTARLFAEDVRRLESADVAATIRRALDEGWLVDRSPDAERHDWKPAQAGDVAILVPTRLSLPALEDALTDAGISYRAESASLVYASRLVRDLLLTLRAIDDPSDELSVVAALRSPLFGCGDDDLFRFRHDHGGRFDPTAGLPEALPDGDAVAAGLAYLHRMHDVRSWRPPSELADAVVRDRRLLELGAAEGRPRDLWRRVRFVLDQARAWTDATNGPLRQYLEWVRQQTAEGSRVAEAVLPETDDDAVRIMTVHAAKGLQFPITIVAGLSTQPQRRSLGAEVAWPPEGEAIIRVGNKVRSAAFDAWLPIDEQMSHDERIRLLYVACTRARDHLVISLHRRVRRTVPDDPARFTSAELLTDALGDLLTDLPDATPPPSAAGDVAAAAATVGRAAEAPGSTTAGPAAAGSSLPPFDDWRRMRDQALAASGRPRTLAATALTDDGQPDALDDPGLHKRPRDLDLPPWQKGRYGTAIGRAVHGVLQTIDLASGGGIAEAVAAQAAAEGVSGHEAHVRRLVDAALRSPSVVAAAGAEHWRELYVGVPVGDGRTLEGYIDLLYRRPGGLVVVDYKTGPQRLDVDLDPLVERYRMQGASYALAIAEATREPVLDMVFVFLTPEGAVERSLPDLAQAVAEARGFAATADPRLVAT